MKVFLNFLKSKWYYIIYIAVISILLFVVLGLSFGTCNTQISKGPNYSMNYHKYYAHVYDQIAILPIGFYGLCLSAIALFVVFIITKIKILSLVSSVAFYMASIAILLSGFILVASETVGFIVNTLYLLFGIVSLVVATNLLVFEIIRFCYDRSYVSFDKENLIAINKLFEVKKLLDEGIISEAEYSSIKEKYVEKL